jgi:hypothetical protein
MINNGINKHIVHSTTRSFMDMFACHLKMIFGMPVMMACSLGITGRDFYHKCPTNGDM